MQEIRDLLREKVFFITGATGFLGQALVEKILYIAPDIRRIYVLIRVKRQFGGRVSTAQERLERELYQSSAFDRLRTIYGDGLESFLRKKLIAIPGDMAKERLGLSKETELFLGERVDVIINSAAVVSFDAPLDQALQSNVMAVRSVARFAAGCAKAVLVHVSTAYVSGATRKTAKESLYHSEDTGNSEPCPVGEFQDVQKDITHIQGIIDRVYEEAHGPEIDRELKQHLLKRPRRSGGARRQRLEGLRRKWIRKELREEGMKWARQRGWNDTYTYTKAMGEQVLLVHREKVATVIIRPSVIESSLAEPSPGWLDGLRMADPLIVAIARGRLKALPLNPDILIDLVPVDVVVNTILASIPGDRADSTVKIYQVATGSENPITLGELYDLIYRYFRKNPLLDKGGRPIRIKRLRFPNPAAFRIQHKLKKVPLTTAERTLERLSIFESTQKVKRRISATKAAQQKLYYYGETYEPYLNLDCRFKVDNTIRLFHSLSPQEKKLFNFDVTRLNWRHYIQNVHIPGVKKYLLKVEGAGTMELETNASNLPVSTISELVDFSAKRFSDKVALQEKRGEEWVRLTYTDVKQLAQQVGDRLRGCGYRKGDRVVLFSENQPEWGVAYLGAVSRGLVVVPIDSQTWHREVWSVARFTGARAILASPSCLARLPKESLKKNEEEEEPLTLLNVNAFCEPFNLEHYPRSTSSTETMAEMAPKSVEVKPEDPASIIFTTGTAVDPKGAVHTHRNFLKNLFGVNRYLAIQETDALLSVLPLYHALEFSCGFLMPIFGGATVTYTRSLKPRNILQTMRETGTTCLLAVPTLYALIRDDIERRILKTSKSALKSNLMATSKQLSKSVARRFGRNIGRRLFSRVHQEFGGKIRVFVSGGSALGQELYEDFKALGLPVYEGYGLTETAPVLTVNPLNLSRCGSAGKPLPGVEVRIAQSDKDGVGEIVVRSPSLMVEYYDNPEATQRVLTQDRWFHTGDLGWVDVDGYIYITGRLKDVIVTGAGKNVYPVDLEAIYRRLPCIKDICVLGIKSGLTEEVHAVVVPEKGHLAPTSEEEFKKTIQREIQKLARELPSYHRLQQIHLWPGDPPVDGEGKLQRKLMRRWVVEQLEERRSLHTELASKKQATREEELLVKLSQISGVPAKEIDHGTDLYSDLGLDSLQAIELLLFVEDKFQVSVADEKAGKLHTVGELLDELREEERGSGTAPRKISSALPYTERPILDRALLTLSFGGLRVLYRFFFGLSLRNPDYLPRESAFIIAANHSSHLDTGAIISALGCARGGKAARRLHVLGARDYFFNSSLRSWLVSRLLNVVPIERKENSLAGLRLVKSILFTGEPVLIFPEGTRTRSGRIQGFKPGLGLMAYETKAPIVPAYIRGAYEALPVGRALPRKRPIEVTFGQVVQLDEKVHVPSKDELYRRFAAEVQVAVESLANGETS